MKLRTQFPLRLALLCLIVGVLASAAAASDVQCIGLEPCALGAEDFLTSPTPGSGIYLCEVPDASVGQLRCGSRVLKTGDVLSADMLSGVVFQSTEPRDAVACVSYYTIWDDKLSAESVLTIRLRSGENHPPRAGDVQLETYKNLERSGKLDAEDPDGDRLTYAVVKTPKRGQVRIEDDGTFVYTPKENKVGADSFTYTATDEQGAVSCEGTVSIEILRPMDKATYADMDGDAAQFEALWLRSTGLLQGDQVTGKLCFRPDETVSRGEYLVMAMELAGVRPEACDAECTFTDAGDAPGWMQPYLSCALRRGIVRGIRRAEGLCFCPHAPVTQAQAAVMTQNLLGLEAPEGQSVFASDDAVPAWARRAVDALGQAGVSLRGTDAPMTRRDTACMLYQISKKLSGGRVR